MVGFALSLTALTFARPFLVVVDPGHGGNDHGAKVRVGKQWVREKEVALKTSEAIASQLRKRGIQVVLTRRQDQSMDLPSRTAMANRLGADLFISVHMNAAHGGGAGGIETYILNNSTNENAQRLADLENSALEGSKAQQLQKLDVALIVKDLMIDANRSESELAACLVQESVVRANYGKNKKKNRGVKQGLFYVLLGADMPSILLELGFLDHPEDRRLVTSYKGRARIAQSVAEAVDRFRRGGARLALKNCKRSALSKL